MWGKGVVAKIKICEERKWGKGRHRVKGEITLFRGRISDVYRNDMYTILAEGKHSSLMKQMLGVKNILTSAGMLDLLACAKIYAIFTLRCHSLNTMRYQRRCNTVRRSDTCE